MEIIFRVDSAKLETGLINMNKLMTNKRAIERDIATVVVNKANAELMDTSVTLGGGGKGSFITLKPKKRSGVKSIKQFVKDLNRDMQEIALKDLKKKRTSL